MFMMFSDGLKAECDEILLASLALIYVLVTGLRYLTLLISTSGLVKSF